MPTDFSIGMYKRFCKRSFQLDHSPEELEILDSFSSSDESEYGGEKPV
jgi:hypothetical protein